MRVKYSGQTETILKEASIGNTNFMLHKMI